MMLATSGPVDAQEDGRPVVIRLRGTTGTERVTVQSGFVKYGGWAPVTDHGEWTLSSDYTEIKFNQSDSFGWFRVNFVNDGDDPVAGDRNVIVDWLDADGLRLQADSPEVRSKGVWNGSDCGEGFRRSGFMACNGWIEIFAREGRNPDRPYPIEVVAQGTTGSELLGYEVDGNVRHTWQLSTSPARYTFEQAIYTGGDRVRLVFLNDGYEPVAGDRNVRVTEISFDEVDYRPGDLKSKGSWNGSDCGEGFRNSQWLHCNGWFEIIGGGDPEPPGSVDVSIAARGTTGTEVLTLDVNGTPFGGIELTQTLLDYGFDVPLDLFVNNDPADPENLVRFRFENDGIDSSGGDRNVFVDAVGYDGSSSNPRALLTKGSWNGTDCDEGYRDSNWLHCNGWIQVWTR